MNKIVIITDSSSNLGTEKMKEFGVAEVIPMHYFMDGVAHLTDCDWKEMTPKEFYDIVRKGVRFKTSQISPAEYKEVFIKYLEQGYDVLSISCTGALSACVRESYVARDELAPKYPKQKIRCIDAACCTYALSMLIKDASKLRDEGKDIDEIVKWVEENKLCYNEIGTVGELTYLRRAGRIKATAAFFGGLFGIKPLIIYDEAGNNVAIEKVKGVKKVFNVIADKIKENIIIDDNHDTIYFAHADALEDAQQLAEIIQSRFDKKLNFVYDYLEPVVGSSVGPGTLILGFYAKKEMRAPLDK